MRTAESAGEVETIARISQCGRRVRGRTRALAPVARTLLQAAVQHGRAARGRARSSRFVAIAMSALGCAFVPEGRHTMRFDLVPEPPGAVFTERTSYFLWALVPTRKIDVLEKCPYGAVAIVDGSEAGGVGVVPTLGLWSRRSTTYYCRRAPSSVVPP